MLRRHREILSCILNTDGFINGSELASVCSVSVRTIQLDIKEINKLLKEYNAQINSEVKKGYYITEKSKEIIRKNNIISTVFDYEYIKEKPVTPVERQIYIMAKTTVKDYVTAEELEDNLYVSVSTINKDIISAAEWLKKNLNLKLEYSLSKGVELHASEVEKRNITSWILSNRQNVSTLKKYCPYFFEGKKFLNSFEKLYSIVDTETKRQGYVLSGHSVQLFCIEILIASARNDMGCTIQSNEEKESELKNIIEELNRKINKDIGITLSKYDWHDLQVHFLSKQFMLGTNIEHIITEEASCIVERFLKVLSIKYDIELTEETLFREKLILYVAPMLNRMRHRHCIGNKITDDVSRSYYLEFNMASEISSIVTKELGLNVRNIELQYLAIHLASIYKLWSKKLKAIIVCDYDESVLSYLKERIIALIEDRIELCTCVTFWQFVLEDEEKFKDIDFIITTSSLAEKTNIPFIQISPVMRQKDISSLYEYMDKLSS